ncbi:MAG: hypothetical protein AB7H43_12815 [Acidimicrobiia bacterium]
MPHRPVRGYLRRLALYLLGAVIGSAAGAMFTWTNDNWVDADPLVDGPSTAMFSLGPAIAAAAPVPKLAGAVVAVLCAASMSAAWWLFAADDSSTSALIFAWGWLAGIPAAAVLLVASRSRRITRPGGTTAGALDHPSRAGGERP